MLFAVTLSKYLWHLRIAMIAHLSAPPAANCVWNSQKSGEPQVIPYIGTLLLFLVTSVTAAYLYYPE